MGCKLVLCTNKKLYAGFRFVPKLVTLREIDRPNVRHYT